MNINMKYYVVTIGAIFLALGVGIIVGFNLNNNEELSKQQAEIISELDKEFGSIKEEKEGVEKTLSETERKYSELINFVNESDMQLGEVSLSGKNIGVISTYGKTSNMDNIKNIIMNYDGNVAFELVFNKEATDKNMIAKAAKETGENLKTAEDVSSYVFDCIKRGDAEEKLEPLKNLKMIEFTTGSENYSSYTSTVILADSEAENSKTQFEALDKYIVSKLKSQNKYVVEAESSSSKTSYVSEYASSKVATVDNANEKTGIYSLVSLLSEENIVGNFGRRDTAASIMPFDE